MEEILAVIFIFGGGTAILLAFSPIGRALADRIRGPVPQVTPSEDLDELRGQLQGIQEQVSELAERQDFTERLLAKQKEKPALGSASETH